MLGDPAVVCLSRCACPFDLGCHLPVASHVASKDIAASSLGMMIWEKALGTGVHPKRNNLQCLLAASVI